MRENLVYNIEFFKTFLRLGELSYAASNGQDARSRNLRPVGSQSSVY